MPTFLLRIKADLDGVDKFWVPDDHCWKLDVRQSGGAEERHGVVVDPDEQVEVVRSVWAQARTCIKIKVTLTRVISCHNSTHQPLLQQIPAYVRESDGCG